MEQNYKEMQMGFDRTQMFKEFIQPQINRAAALRAVLDFCQINQVQLSNELLFRLVTLYIKFIETGDREWVSKVDEYINKTKRLENV